MKRAGEAPVALPTGWSDGNLAQVSTAFNQMTEALQQAEATRALMLAGVSHDIRTPLIASCVLAMADGHSGAARTISSSRQRKAICDHIAPLILQQFMDYA